MLVQNICSKEAYNMLVSNNNTFLVDVRTEEEWKNVGVPSLSNKNNVIFLSWQLSPFMELNKDFEDRFLSIIDDKMSNIIFFLCRSGHRSLMAANFMANIGYKNCYNIIDGFEGNLQNKGWKQNNLPWQF
ncbi:MAG TPA: rhodanese-like domain-containing protein [Rickettsia endosymbiont of Bembidion nr. Transversale]|nr:rhodanese-like domain-containing protein [Rickettsia endosymbiont of Stiretrus anchorago]HJD65738.1 rhodanese-like domain-containing protein [Rickettsia endosymbiont of Bembidion nr. Transversale]